MHSPSQGKILHRFRDSSSLIWPLNFLRLSLRKLLYDSLHKYAILNPADYNQTSEPVSDIKILWEQISVHSRPAMTQHTLSRAFQRSFLEYLDYPSNLVLVGSWTYASTLKSYKNRLDDVSSELFLDEQLAPKKFEVPIRDLQTCFYKCEKKTRSKDISEK